MYPDYFFFLRRIIAKIIKPTTIQIPIIIDAISIEFELLLDS